MGIIDHVLSNHKGAAVHFFSNKKEAKNVRKKKKKKIGEIQDLKLCHVWYIWWNWSKDITAPQHPEM